MCDRVSYPGGCPPQAVCERLGQPAVCEEQISVDMMQQRAVVAELFSSICAEIRDEVSGHIHYTTFLDFPTIVHLFPRSLSPSDLSIPR